MKKIIIQGGRPLCGRVQASGSKNAALPLLFAAAVVGGTSALENVPELTDVTVALSLLSELGVTHERQNGRLILHTEHMSYRSPSPALAARLRASTYLLSVMLARFGRAELLPFGGCAFCPRPIDLHVEAAVAFGAVQEEGALVASKLRGGVFRPRLVSVGATVNALLLAVAAEGPSRIYSPALEPHVCALIAFLRSAGAKIQTEGDCLCVTPAPLHGTSVGVIPDMIEAGTYLLAGMVSGGDVTVEGVDPSHLSSFTAALGAERTFTVTEHAMRARYVPLAPKTVTAAPHPCFPTDLQPPTAVLLARCGGRMWDRVFPGRFGYLETLSAFGLQYQKQAQGVSIFPSRLHGGTCRISELRGGAAALLCALAAPGESVIENAELLSRGYENIEQKLSFLGANVQFM